MDKNFRLHCEYRQLGARTGRLSCVDPDLQAVLKDEKVRKIFVGLKNFLCADYSQMEAVLYANRTNDDRLCTAFGAGEDVYANFAATIFKLTPEQVKADCPFQPGTSYRDFCKGIFLGMMYGMGEAKFKRMTGEDVYQTLVDAFPILSTYQKHYIKIIQQQGAARTHLGRYRRLLPHDAYKGVNADIQGSARDVLATVMINLPKSIQERLVISVHDELDFEDIEEPEVKTIVECMKDFEFKVPLRVKIGVGANWWEASKGGVIK